MQIALLSVIMSELDCYVYHQSTPERNSDPRSFFFCSDVFRSPDQEKNSCYDPSVLLARLWDFYDRTGNIALTISLNGVQNDNLWIYILARVPPLDRLSLQGQALQLAVAFKAAYRFDIPSEVLRAVFVKVLLHALSAKKPMFY